MSIEITMPKLSDTMEEGKILHWLKRPGDQVRHGEPLAEVETDKADMVLEAFDDGVLQELRLAEGDSAPVGTVIALMGAPGETAAQKPQPEARPAPEPTPPPPPSPPQTQTAPPEQLSATEQAPELTPAAPQAKHEEVHKADAAEEGERIRVSPLARRAAEEAGVDLRLIRGSGVDGRITKQDVDAALMERGAAPTQVKPPQLVEAEQRPQETAQPSNAPIPPAAEAARHVAPGIPTFEAVPGVRQEMSKMRRSIAQRLTASKQEIPHYYVTVEVDMQEAARFRKSLETTKLFDEPITYNDIVVKACALALTRHPQINGSYQEHGLQIHPNINIGMAVAVEDGLIVPVIRDCQKLNLPEIARTAHRLAALAQEGRFTSEQLSGGTFTISNLGMLGVEHFIAVINPPQAAILAVGAIKQRPVLRNGQVVVGTTMLMTLSCDHRIIDGVVAGRFLLEVKRFLENPASLLL